MVPTTPTSVDRCISLRNRLWAASPQSKMSSPRLLQEGSRASGHPKDSYYSAEGSLERLVHRKEVAASTSRVFPGTKNWGWPPLPWKATSPPMGMYYVESFGSDLARWGGNICSNRRSNWCMLAPSHMLSWATSFSGTKYLTRLPDIVKIILIMSNLIVA
jgi:hypothetical protein